MTERVKIDNYEYLNQITIFQLTLETINSIINLSTVPYAYLKSSNFSFMPQHNIGHFSVGLIINNNIFVECLGKRSLIRKSLANIQTVVSKIIYYFLQLMCILLLVTCCFYAVFCSVQVLNQSFEQSTQNFNKNIYGQPLQLCSLSPLTGWKRDGYCNTDQNDHGTHTVCAIVTNDFLQFCKNNGNDLITPNQRYSFPGLKEGDSWCICALWFKRAIENNHSVQIKLKSTNRKTLQFLDQATLEKYSKVQ